MTAPADRAAAIIQRIRDRAVTIAVVGCGYVGLPLAIAFARAGFTVLGLDVDQRKVDVLERGESHILDVPGDLVREQRDAGRFTATTDAGRLKSADVIFVSVPTPFDRAKQPDLRFVISAAEAVSASLRVGQLIILESTTYPGTTDEVMRPVLERSGLVAGLDFYLAFSPERIDPGNRRFGIHNTPKVVGGIDAMSTQLAAELLAQVVTEGAVHQVSSARAAELTKLLENTFRAVNIALVNEIAMLCDRMQIDIWEVIQAAATKPYGFMPFYPGPGVGGHCIPVDPYYLSWKAREYDFHTKFIELAAETNLAMPFFTADRVRRLLSEVGKPLHGARLLVIGAAFKKDIDDARNSTAIRTMEILQREGARIEYHDPFVGAIRLSSSLYSEDGPSVALRSTDLTDEVVAKADAVVILVGHSRVDYPMILRAASLVFDAVNATHDLAGEARLERL